MTLKEAINRVFEIVDYLAAHHGRCTIMSGNTIVVTDDLSIVAGCDNVWEILNDACAINHQHVFQSNYNKLELQRSIEELSEGLWDDILAVIGRFEGLHD